MTTLALVAVERNINITGIIEDLFDAYYQLYRVHKTYMDYDEPILLEDWSDWLGCLQSSMDAVEEHLRRQQCFILVQGKAKNMPFLSVEPLDCRLLDLKLLDIKIMP